MILASYAAPGLANAGGPTYVEVLRSFGPFLPDVELYFSGRTDSGVDCSAVIEVRSERLSFHGRSGSKRLRFELPLSGKDEIGNSVGVVSFQAGASLHSLELGLERPG